MTQSTAPQLKELRKQIQKELDRSNASLSNDELQELVDKGCILLVKKLLKELKAKRSPRQT